MPQVEPADPGLADTASVGLCFRSSPSQCPCCTTGMCAPDRRRAGGRSTALCHATLLPGRTPRGGGRRYRRRDGVGRFGGRRRRVSAHMRAISLHAGRHFSSPLHFRAQRLTHPKPKGPSHTATHIRIKTARDGRLSDGAEALYARSAVSYGSVIKKSGTKRLSCTGGVERKRQGACLHRHGRQCCVSSPIVPLARIKRIPTSAGWGPQRYMLPRNKAICVV